MSKPRKIKDDESINIPSPAMKTWGINDDSGRINAYTAYAQALEKATALSTYKNIAPGNVSIRDGYDKRDYDYFRPGERTPRDQLEVVTAAMQAYERVGIVRNIIDMMGDFVTQGIDIVHPRPRIETWLKAWAKKVNMKDRTERFANMLYRAGTCVIQRHTARIQIKNEKDLLKGIAKPDVEFQDPIKLAAREIPMIYTLHNPLQIEIIGGDLSIFAGPIGFRYAIRIPEAIIRKIKFPRTEAEKEIIKNLPPEVRQAILDGEKSIELDDDKVSVLYYKRDDWNVWATPMISSVLPDLRVYEKLKLTDISALDGAISNIRLWTLGSFEYKVLPTEFHINKLADVLTNNVGGGCIDLIWGPELTMTQAKTDVYKFLGNEKYVPTLQAIYGGLGIPPTLTGANSGGGFTNNFISLRTLTERLEYVRDILTRFWEKELALVQKAMGFRDPARLVFDRMVLTDEAAEKQLLINMCDRDLISMETLQARFGEIPEIEQVRLRREKTAREDGSANEKAGPFHKTQLKEDIKKIFAQNGNVAPSQVGLDLEDKKDGEEIPMDKQAKLDMKTQVAKQKAKPKTKIGGKNKGQPGQGRSKGKKDSSKRKKKLVQPRSSASTIVENFHWAEEAQKSIASITTPAFLGSIEKKNLRQLTTEEFDEYENLKFHVLCSLEPGCEVTNEVVQAKLSNELPIQEPIKSLYERCLSMYDKKYGGAPTVEVSRQIQAQVYSLIYSKDEESENGKD